MKLFEMEGFLRGKCLPGDMKINETNAEYLVRKFAELEARCAALAAENAGLKEVFSPKEIPSEAVDAFSDTAAINHDWDESGSWSWVDNESEVIRAVLDAIKPETPATDAFLAEVRAQGVKSAGEYLKQYAQGLHEEARLVLQDAGELCNGFAAQILQEAAL